MSKEKTPSKKLQQLLADLNSKDEKKVLKTITVLEADGNAEILRPICELLLENQSTEIGSKVKEFLSKLSDSSATQAMMEILRDDKFLPIRLDLLNCMWQNKLDFTPFLADFVSFACEGSFLESFECLTIIENLKGPFEESQTLESQLYLKEYLESEKGKDESRDEIISDIAVLIKDFDWGIDD